MVLKYYTTSVLHEYGADAFFTEKMTGQLSFFPMISYGASISFCNNFSSPPAMKYDKFCAILDSRHLQHDICKLEKSATLTWEGGEGDICSSDLLLPVCDKGFWEDCSLVKKRQALMGSEMIFLISCKQFLFE